MTIAETFLPEFDQEMATTRRLLERVPGEKGTWKPHEKSFPLGHLAQLISWMPGWISSTLRSSELDLAAGGGGYTFEPTEKLLEDFDRNVREAREALAAAEDADFGVPWSLKMRDRVLYTLPRGVVVRQHINHLIHHRGQLSVYLRLLDVPLPSIYGPTADEKMAMEAR
ncbi:MAG TPA: DinB family protein [Longimicrobiales bacterium]